MPMFLLTYTVQGNILFRVDLVYFYLNTSPIGLKMNYLLHCVVGGCCSIRPLATRSSNVDFPALSNPIIRSLAFDFRPRK